MAGRTDPTFVQRAQAAAAGPSQLDGLLGGVLTDPAAAALHTAHRAIAHEKLDFLAARLFHDRGGPALSVAEAEQQLAQKRQRLDKISATLPDGGAAHWKTVARYERYIALRRQKDAEGRQLQAEKERWRQEVQQHLHPQQEAAPPPPPPDEQQQQPPTASKAWLHQALDNAAEARQQQQQRQEQRTKGFAVKPLAPDSRYNVSQYGYSEDSADFRNNAPQASRGAPGQSKRRQQLLNVSGAQQQQQRGGRGAGGAGRGGGAQAKQLQGPHEPPILARSCKFCFKEPSPGRQLKVAKFKDNGQEVVVCFECLEKNTKALEPVVFRKDAAAMPQQAAQQGQRGKPKVQGLTSQTGLPAGTFYGSSGKLPLPLERSTAGGAAAAAGGASGRAPMRGKGKQPQRRKGGEDSDGDYVPDQAAAVQGSDDDSLMGPTLGGRRGRPHTRRGAKQQQADSEPICIDLLSDEDGGGSTSPSDGAAATAAAAAAGAGAPAAGEGRRRPPRLTRANEFLSTSERFQGLKCLYPPGGGPGAVEVTHLDLPRLDPEEFLNDTVIDFYVRWLQDQLPPEVRQRCYFFNTFFFKKLTEKEGGKATPEIEELCKERGWGPGHTMRQALLNHQKVKKWTKDVDLFGKDFIFVPVHEALHWSLMVVCHPGELMPPKGQGTKSPSARRLAPGQKTPCILHLDSLSGSHNAKAVANTLRLYLNFEWMFKSQSGPEDSVPRRWAAAHPGQERKWFPDEVPYKPVKLPKQDNHCDCGLFVCTFIEFFTYRLPPAICTADLEQLKHTYKYKTSVRDLFEGRPEAYYPGMLTEHWFPADNPSKLRWFVRLKVVELMAEQNGYLAAPGTEQEAWLEGPDPVMRERLQNEIERLRGVVGNNGYLSPAAYQPQGEEDKQRRKAAAERRQQQGEQRQQQGDQSQQQQKAGRQARQAAAAKRPDDDYEYEPREKPSREQLAAAAEARMGAGASAQQGQQAPTHPLFNGVQEVAQQGDSGETREGSPFEPEQLPSGRRGQQQQQQQQSWAQQDGEDGEDGDVELTEDEAEAALQPDSGFQVDLEERQEGQVDLQPSPNWGEMPADELEHREAARPHKGRQKRDRRQERQEEEEREEEEGEEGLPPSPLQQQHQQQQHQQQGRNPQGPAAAGEQQQGAPAAKRQRGGQHPEQRQQQPVQSPSSSTADEDEELEIVEPGHHQPPPPHQQHHQHHQQPPYQQHQQSPYQQHQHPQQQYQALPIPYPQHQQLPIPGTQQQRVPPAGGGAAVPPLDWSRVVQVAAVLREVEGPPEQPPDQQQRVELRVWYRDQGSDHSLQHLFEGGSTFESVVALCAWMGRHMAQLRPSTHGITRDFQAVHTWMLQHGKDLQQAQQLLRLAQKLASLLQPNAPWQPPAPPRGSSGQGNGGAAAGGGRAVDSMRLAALRAEGAIGPVEPLVAAALDPEAQQGQQQWEQQQQWHQQEQWEEAAGYEDAPEDSQPLPATQELSGSSGDGHSDGWHDATSGAASPPDPASLAAAAAAAAAAAGGELGSGGEADMVLVGQMDGMHLNPQPQQAQQAQQAVQQQDRPWRDKSRPGSARRSAELLQRRNEQQAQQQAAAGVEDEVDLTVDEAEPAQQHRQPTPAQQQKQQHLQHQQHVQQRWQEQHRQDAAVAMPPPASQQQPGRAAAQPRQPAGAKRGAQPPEQPLTGQQQPPPTSNKRRKGKPSHREGAGPGWAEPPPASQAAAEEQWEQTAAQTAQQRRQRRQMHRQATGDVATSSFNQALYGDPAQGAAAAAAGGGHVAGPQMQLQQQQQAPQQQASLGRHGAVSPSGLRQMVPRTQTEPPAGSWAGHTMARAGSEQAATLWGRPSSAGAGGPVGSAAQPLPGGDLLGAPPGSAGAGTHQLGQPPAVEPRYSAAGMQQAKQPLQQFQQQRRAIAEAEVDEAVAAAQHSLEAKAAAAPAAVPASMNGDQFRAAGNGVAGRLAHVAAQRKLQVQSAHKQARAAAVALPAVAGPASTTVDLTGDAD